MGRALVWFRRDLRLADNPAWSEACSDHSVLPVFVLEPGLLRAAGGFRKHQLFGNQSKDRIQLILDRQSPPRVPTPLLHRSEAERWFGEMAETATRFAASF